MIFAGSVKEPVRPNDIIFVYSRHVEAVNRYSLSVKSMLRESLDIGKNKEAKCIPIYWYTLQIADKCGEKISPHF